MFIRWKRRAGSRGWSLDAVLVESMREPRVDSVDGKLRHRRVPRLKIIAALGTLSCRSARREPSPALRRRVRHADPALVHGDRAPRSMREAKLMFDLIESFTGTYNGDDFLKRATDRVLALGLDPDQAARLVAALTAKVEQHRPVVQ